MDRQDWWGAAYRKPWHLDKITSELLYFYGGEVRYCTVLRNCSQRHGWKEGHQTWARNRDMDMDMDMDLANCGAHPIAGLIQRVGFDGGLLGFVSG